MFKEGIQHIALSKSKTFLAFCFLFLISSGGATAYDFLQVYAFYFFIALITFLILLIFAWKNKVYRLVVLSLIALSFGLWRGALALPDSNDINNIGYYVNRFVTITGFVRSEPNIGVDKASYTVQVTSIQTNGTSSVVMNGSVLVKTKLYPEFHYGDMLTVSCRLEKPVVDDGSVFRYDKYLAKEGVQVLCSFPKKMSLASSDNKIHAWRSVLSKILQFKTRIQEQLNRLWNEPDSSFMAGLLFGSKSGLPLDMLADFSKTGVTHIIAVSGFNITIIAATLMTVLVLLGFWRQQAFWVVIMVLVTFVIFTGATASVVRAAYMGSLVLIAKHIGRSSRMENVLVFSAAMMILINPYLLLWDAGFQLSFLATMGLVYVSPVLQSVIPNPDSDQGEESSSFHNQPARFLAALEKTKTALFGVIYEPFIQTLSAIIATLPLILYEFGTLSLVAPLVNVLVLFTIPWLMLGGFVSLVVSFIFYPPGQLCAWITGVGLKYVLFVVEFFGSKKWVAVTWHMPFFLMGVVYITLIFVIARSSGGTTKQEVIKTNLCQNQK